MIQNFSTARLTLSPLQIADSAAILAILNAPGFIRFIGDRQVRTLEDASWYIKRILDDPGMQYWIVKLKNDGSAIGTITFIKRDYLDHHDIGFAFLPSYTKMGYAFEAANTVLQQLIADADHQFVLATTAKDNMNSIRLLEKLGLQRQNKIKIGDREAWLYSMKLKEI